MTFKIAFHIFHEMNIKLKKCEIPYKFLDSLRNKWRWRWTAREKERGSSPYFGEPKPSEVGGALAGAACHSLFPVFLPIATQSFKHALLLSTLSKPSHSSRTSLQEPFFWGPQFTYFPDVLQGNWWLWLGANWLVLRPHSSVFLNCVAQTFVLCLFHFALLASQWFPCTCPSLH